MIETIRQQRWHFWVAQGLILIAATSVRIWAAHDDFWLDEIWSLMGFAATAKSPAAIFLRPPHDNNHYLMTLLMYLSGPQENWFVYRIPSLLAGVGTVVLAALAARPWGSWPALAASLFTGSSYLLIVYASEARGYALAGFFALAGYLSLQRFLAARSTLACFGFWLTVILGLLSHLTFIHFYAGACAWSIYSLWRQGTSSRGLMRDLAYCHAVPLAFVAAVYLFIVRRMGIGGGDSYVLGDVLAETLALSVGGPIATAGAAFPELELLAGLLAVAAGLTGIVWLRNEKSPLWVFFAVTVYLSPAMLLLLKRPEVLYPRYFYINILFFLVLLSYVAGRLTRHGTAGRATCAIACAIFVAGNAGYTAEFLRYGRGGYLEALQYMAEQSSGREIHVGSDHDFRNAWTIGFYSHYLPKEQGLTYHSWQQLATHPPEYFVVHSSEPKWNPAETIRDPAGNPYKLVRLFPYAGLSGFHWAVYRRLDGSP